MGIDGRPSPADRFGCRNEPGAPALDLLDPPLDLGGPGLFDLVVARQTGDQAVRQPRPLLGLRAGSAWASTISSWLAIGSPRQTILPHRVKRARQVEAPGATSDGSEIGQPAALEIEPSATQTLAAAPETSAAAPGILSAVPAADPSAAGASAAVPETSRAAPAPARAAAAPAAPAPSAAREAPAAVCAAPAAARAAPVTDAAETAADDAGAAADGAAPAADHSGTAADGAGSAADRSAPDAARSVSGILFGDSLDFRCARGAPPVIPTTLK